MRTSSKYKGIGRTPAAAAHLSCFQKSVFDLKVSTGFKRLDIKMLIVHDVSVKELLLRAFLAARRVRSDISG